MWGQRLVLQGLHLPVTVIIIDMHIEGQWVIEKPVDSSHLLKLNNASRLIFFWLQGFALLLLCALQKIQMDQIFSIFFTLSTQQNHMQLLSIDPNLLFDHFLCA